MHKFDILYGKPVIDKVYKYKAESKEHLEGSFFDLIDNIIAGHFGNLVPDIDFPESRIRTYSHCFKLDFVLPLTH